MQKRKAQGVVQEVTFVQKKTRRGGRKLQAKVITGSPVTPSTVRSHSTFHTPAQSPKIPSLHFDESDVGAPSAVRARTTKHGWVCDLEPPPFLLMLLSVPKRLHARMDIPT
jgi:hypothetical protein